MENNRIHNAVEKYLDLQGYEFIDWIESDICRAVDGETEDMALIQVVVSEREFLDSNTRGLTVNEFDERLMEIVSYEDIPLGNIRYDFLNVNTLDDDKAFIKHHVKAPFRDE